LGWALYIHNTLFINRNLTVDKVIIENYVSNCVKNNNKLWLHIFPEGTYITPDFKEAQLKSIEFEKKTI